MQPASFEQLAAVWPSLLDAEHDDVDRWCSALPWSLAVREAFAPELDDVFGVSEGGAAMLLRHRVGGGHHVLVPFDVMWSFATPVLGIGDRDAAADLARFALVDGAVGMFLGGLPEGGRTWRAFVDALADLRLYLGEERIRCHASLDGGIDGYLGRRTRAFRRNLRQLDRRLAATSVTIEVVDDERPHVLVERLHAIEQRSWKGRDGSGIASPDMRHLYELLAADLAERGALRAAIARDGDGHDLAFILGGVLGSTYRGLQLSFDDDARALGLGNWLQWHEIRRLISCEPHVRTYDLGMDMAYKRLWAEGLHTTRTLIAVR